MVHNHTIKGVVQLSLNMTDHKRKQKYFPQDNLIYMLQRAAMPGQCSPLSDGISLLSNSSSAESFVLTEELHPDAIMLPDPFHTLLAKSAYAEGRYIWNFYFVAATFSIDAQLLLMVLQFFISG